MDESRRPVRVLSIDGGGIRGYIPALVLALLEEVTKRPVADMFDVIAGTSTGGILALGLTVPGADGRPDYSAEELADLYRKWGKQIFPSGGAPTWKERLLGRGNTFAERMGSAARAGGAPFGGNPKCGGNARHTALGLEETVAAYFGQHTLADALTEVLVTSFDNTNGRPFIFSRSDALSKGVNLPMAVVARATSAAPTFFSPQRISLQPGTPMEMIDGGVWANNPATIAYHHAVRLASQRGLTGDSVQLVSLGTGSAPETGGRFASSGSWLNPLMGLAAMATDTNIVDFTLAHHLNSDGERRYWRFQTFAAGATGAMDDPTPERLDTLRDAAIEMIQSRHDELQQLIDTLSQ